MAPPSRSSFPAFLMITIKSLKSVDKEIWALVITTGALLLVLLNQVSLNLNDPTVYAETMNIHFSQALREGQEVDLGSSWDVSGEGIRAKEKRASLNFETPPGPWAKARVNINGDADTQWTIRLARNYQAASFPKVIPGVPYDISGERLPYAGRSTDPLAVTLYAQEEGVLLSKIRIELSPDIRTKKEWNLGFTGALFGSLLPLALFFFLRFGRERTVRLSAAIALFSSLILVFIVISYSRALQFLLPLAVGLFLSGGFSYYLKKYTKKTSGGENISAGEWVPAFCFGVALLGISLWARWNQFELSRYDILRPDAQGYFEIASKDSFWPTIQSNAPYVRELLFPLLMKVSFLVFPETWTAARVFSLLLGSLLPLLIFALGWRLFTPVVAIFSAFVIAIHPYFVQMSVEVLRDDLITLIYLLLALLMILDKDTLPQKLYNGLLGAGLVCLIFTKASALIAGFFFIAIAWQRGLISKLTAGICVALSLIAIFPYMIANLAIQPGAPFFAENLHLSYYENRFLVNQAAENGLTLAEWQSDPYGNEGTSLLSYIGTLGAGGFLKVVFIDSPMALFAYFPHGELFRGQEWPFLFLFLGFVYIVRDWRKYLHVLIPTAALILPLFLVAGVKLDTRLASVVGCWAILIFFFGLERTALLIQQKLSGNVKSS